MQSGRGKRTSIASVSVTQISRNRAFDGNHRAIYSVRAIGAVHHSCNDGERITESCVSLVGSK
jgi:hypothetical protein